MDPSLYHPKYWLSWFAILVLRIAAALPFKAKLIAGRALGLLVFHLVKKRRHTVQTNVRLCFPELSPEQQKKMVSDIFDVHMFPMTVNGLEACMAHLAR